MNNRLCKIASIPVSLILFMGVLVVFDFFNQWLYPNEFVPKLPNWLSISLVVYLMIWFGCLLIVFYRRSNRACERFWASRQRGTGKEEGDDSKPR